MSGPKYLVDPACHDLAEHFLADEPRETGDTIDLAAEIQSVIELWLNARKKKGQNDGIQR